MTDPERLAPAPVVVTSTSDLLHKGTHMAIDTVSGGLAGAAGLAAYAALGGGPTQGELDSSTVIGVAVPVAVTFSACQGLFRSLLGRRGARIAARPRD
jgi:hypothetical protein